jgi:hypothetical protein
MGFPVYETFNYNFGSTIYKGDDFEAAKAAAVKSGFEASITRINDCKIVAAYSPITGIKTY